jgi:hypothetical protein
VPCFSDGPCNPPKSPLYVAMVAAGGGSGAGSPTIARGISERAPARFNEVAQHHIL